MGGTGIELSTILTISTEGGAIVPRAVCTRFNQSHARPQTTHSGVGTKKKGAGRSPRAAAARPGSAHFDGRAAEATALAVPHEPPRARSRLGLHGRAPRERVHRGTVHRRVRAHV
eukprot:3936624-Rhodomonas_salina.1